MSKINDEKQQRRSNGRLLGFKEFCDKQFPPQELAEKAKTTVSSSQRTETRPTPAFLQRAALKAHFLQHLRKQKANSKQGSEGHSPVTQAPGAASSEQSRLFRATSHNLCAMPETQTDSTVG